LNINYLSSNIVYYVNKLTLNYRKSPEDKLAVDILHSSDKFLFTVETTGALTAREVVKDAITVLTEKITNLQQLVAVI